MKKIKRAKWGVLGMIGSLLSISLFSFSAHAQTIDSQTSNNNVQSLKGDMINLSAELRMLEEQLLFPDADKVAVFLSVNAPGKFVINGVKLVLDDVVVVDKNYDAKQTDALNRGGVERLYMGDIAVGEHQLTAFFMGLDQMGNKTKRALTTTFVKVDKANAIELQVVIGEYTRRPEFIAKEL